MIRTPILSFFGNKDMKLFAAGYHYRAGFYHRAGETVLVGLLVHTEAWPPGASHHWSRAEKLDKKVTTEGSWTGVPCKALPPMHIERTDAAARSEITPILAPFRAHPKDREQEELLAATLSEDPQAKQDSSCLASLETPRDSHESA